MIDNILIKIYMYLHDNHRKWFYDKFGPGTGGIGEAYAFIIGWIVAFLFLILTIIIGVILWLMK